MQKPASKTKTAVRTAKDRQADSVGYPALEELLEEENPDLSSMFETSKQLIDLSTKAKTAKEKAAAKHASLAYERFFDLFKSLLQIKQNLIEQKIAEQKPGKKR